MSQNYVHFINGEAVPFTPEEIAEWQAETAAHAARAERARILAQLEELDRRSIRALREGDSQRIAELEAEAILYRQRLAQLMV